jgi:uncharacterized protein YecE (DUF72 family)
MSAPRMAIEKPSTTVQHAGLFIGPAGWAYKDWNGIVYPTPRPRGFHQATYLAEFFDTIEINTSFYHPLQAAHAAQWLGRVAANPRFLFTAKLWQKFTHEGGTNAEDEKAVRAGFDLLRGADKLGAVLLQFPFSFHFERDNLARLKHVLDSFRDYPLVVEVRHSSWANVKFYELLQERGVGFCNIDQPVIGRSIEPSAIAWATVRYLVQRRPIRAGCGAIQLPLFGEGTGAVGCEGSQRIEKYANDIRHHKQSFRGQRYRKRASAHPFARWRESKDPRNIASPLSATRFHRYGAFKRTNTFPSSAEIRDASMNEQAHNCILRSVKLGFRWSSYFLKRSSKALRASLGRPAAGAAIGVAEA